MCRMCVLCFSTQSPRYKGCAKQTQKLCISFSIVFSWAYLCEAVLYSSCLPTSRYGFQTARNATIFTPLPLPHIHITLNWERCSLPLCLCMYNTSNGKAQASKWVAYMCVSRGVYVVNVFPSVSCVGVCMWRCRTYVISVEAMGWLSYSWANKFCIFSKKYRYGYLSVWRIYNERGGVRRSKRR